MSLQAAAEIVLQKENGLKTANRVSAPNYDGSLDLGCLQINNKAHFGSKGWTNYSDIFNPDFNATYAYKIYQGRGNFSAWYAVCTPNRVSKFEGIQC